MKSWEGLKGRKCRQTGLTAEVMAKAGITPVNMPGGEIVPAAELGVIECAEWSVHEPAPILEVLLMATCGKSSL